MRPKDPIWRNNSHSLTGRKFLMGSGWGIDMFVNNRSLRAEVCAHSYFLLFIQHKHNAKPIRNSF